MKKILLSLGLIAIVAAVSISATGAFFSDTETSTANVFTAGAIDLKIDSKGTYNGQPVTSATWQLKDLVPTSDKFFNFGDIKPGDTGENSISIHVINNDAWVCAAVTNLQSDDNGLTEPESKVDATDGSGNGELDEEMVWKIWRDDGTGGGVAGDNIQNGTEPTLASGNPVAGVLALYDSTTGTGPLTGATTAYIGVNWELPGVSGNKTQTDSLSADFSFYAVQSRNNMQFKCSDWQPVGEDNGLVIVTLNSLETESKVDAYLNGNWFFYNDTNDTIMSINQFSGTGGVNDIVSGPGAVGAAQMTLHNDANARYNIATYQFKDVKLADISSLKYRIYDASASSQTPYLHFNVDFDNSDTWQRRLVQVPTGVSVNTWTEVDALSGMWTLSGGNWPVGVNTLVPFSGVTARTWADIIADYPNAETRSTDSFFGVRVGHPGPAGEISYVDWVEFDGQVYDFEN